MSIPARDERRGADGPHLAPEASERAEFARRIDCADGQQPAAERGGRAPRGRGVRDGETWHPSQYRLDV